MSPCITLTKVSNKLKDIKILSVSQITTQSLMSLILECHAKIRKFLVLFFPKLNLIIVWLIYYNYVLFCLPVNVRSRVSWSGNSRKSWRISSRRTSVFRARRIPTVSSIYIINCQLVHNTQLYTSYTGTVNLHMTSIIYCQLVHDTQRVVFRIDF